MNIYGYIEDKYLEELDTVYWGFSKFMPDGKIKNYHGFETIGDAPTGSVIIGNNKDFRLWLNEVFINSPNVKLNGDNFTTEDVIKSLEFNSKIPRNLNTAVDVYFTFEEETHGVRFQDWNIFRTLTDEQCEEKLRKYLIDNTEIKHPAKPLEQ